MACDVLQPEAGRRISHQAFQTNATRINDNWKQCLSQTAASVGVSLSGRPDINEHRRKERRGQGTYFRVLEGIARLRNANVPFHIICVVIAEALYVPERLASALATTGSHSIGTNVEEADGVHASSSLTMTHRERYRQLLCCFLETLEGVDAPPRLRATDQIHSARAAWKMGTRFAIRKHPAGCHFSWCQGRYLEFFAKATGAKRARL